MSFTILTGKEGAAPKKPLFLLTIVSPDGDTVYLTTASSYGAPHLVYGGNTYLAKIQKNDIQAIQATGPQGYDSVPGFTATLADGDHSLWNDHVVPHGWRGAIVTLTAILWDVVANAYSTDALQWTFIGGNPSHNHAQGQTILKVMSSTNFTRLKVPSIPLEYRCSWNFPSTSAQQTSGLNDPTSIYFQCGYSPAVGGVGNGSFTSCAKTRSDCMARMGNSATTSVAPDGDITHDTSGRYTARFGGVTWLAPASFDGKKFTDSSKIHGYNQPNAAVPGSYYNWVYGTQWVQCTVLAPAGDPNSNRAEAIVCVAAFGSANVLKLLVNGTEIPQNGSDVLFTWRYITAGGRSGALNADAIFNRHGDPHGSMCCVEFVVPAELSQPGSLPDVKALVTGGPILNCYAIGSVTSGVVTFTGPNWSCAGNPPFSVIIVGNSNGALNGVWQISSWTGGPPGTITLSGSSASGTGGSVFFYMRPDLFDSSGNIVTNPTGNDPSVSGPACNLAFALLDLITWGNVPLSQIDAAAWYQAAQDCKKAVSYTAADGSTQTHAQFKASFALLGNQRQTLAQVVTAARNSGNIMIGQSAITGLIQASVRKTLADQQPAVVPGSNDTTARTSKTAAGSAADGYFAYLFDASNIEKDSFKITTTDPESTPNLVSFQFQDEQNGYQTDSMTTIDDLSYLYSGNQEIAVPVPVNAVPNFDQGTRVGNVQLAEALFGNFRDDQGGTDYFEFSTNQRVLHLVTSLGMICGLVWDELSVGTSADPQAIRIISAKPDTDGEHWTIKAQWHNDDWYTFAYGQDPTQFTRNPLLDQPARPPFPWRPGVAVWDSSDAMFPDQNSFQFDVDTSSYPSQINIQGAVPVNSQPAGLSALVPAVGNSGNTGGTIKPGTYFVQLSSDDENGPVSKICTIVIPAGTNTNTITVTNVMWRSGAAPSIQPFIGTSALNMRVADVSTYSGSAADAFGNPTTFTFTAFSPDGAGLPDINASAFFVEEIGIIHGGDFGDGVGSVDGTGLILTLENAGGWTTNQWQNHILSLYYRPGAVPQPALNMLVSSSDANTLTMPATGFLAGDVVVMRMLPDTFTSNTVGDSNLVNPYAPSGLGVDEDAGHQIYILAGTGAGYPPKTIKSNTATVFTITDKWDVIPDATSVILVLDPTVAYEYTTKPFTNDGTAPALNAIASTPAITAAEQSLLVTVSTCDSQGNCYPWQYQPKREVYIPPQPAVSGTGSSTGVTINGVQVTY